MELVLQVAELMPVPVLVIESSPDSVKRLKVGVAVHDRDSCIVIDLDNVGDHVSVRKKLVE